MYVQGLAVFCPQVANGFNSTLLVPHPAKRATWRNKKLSGYDLALSGDVCMRMCTVQRHACTTHACVYIYIYMYVSMYVCMYVCMCMCVNIYIYTHTYTYIYNYIYIYGDMHKFMHVTTGVEE